VTEPTHPLAADDRPFDHTPVTTAELPATPTRDRNIGATAWGDAPRTLLELGRGLVGTPEAAFKRRIFGWLLWRAGPTRGPCRYLAIDPSDLSRTVTFEIFTGGEASGHGPDGVVHDRFRSWKESLRAHPIG